MLKRSCSVLQGLVVGCHSSSPACSMLTPGQLRSRLLLGFPLALQTCRWSKWHSGLLFPPEGQERGEGLSRCPTAQT